MKKIYLFLTALTWSACPAQENYVRTTTYKQPVSDPATSADPSQVAIGITYIDGLGRPVQQRAHKQSATGKDIVTHIEYDNLGRQTRDYLPYVSASPSLQYSASAGSEVMSFYASQNLQLTGNPAFETTGNPYSEKTIENSPLARQTRQAFPGNDWVSLSLNTPAHVVVIDYRANIASDGVKKYAAPADVVSNGCYSPVLSQQGTYPAGKLYKTVTADENYTSGNLHTSEEYKDGEGRIVLKRTYTTYLLEGSPTLQRLDTYYVYDQFGNLAFVLPPLYGSPSQLDALCYQYRYDHRNRLVEKKIPGRDWEYIVYDRLDRPIMTGPVYDPFGKGELGWTFIKYDGLGRTAYSGWIESRDQIDSKARYSHQDVAQSASIVSESRSAPSPLGDFTGSYTNLAYPQIFKYLLGVSYYDDYNAEGMSLFPSDVEGVAPVGNAKGLPTISWARVLTSDQEFLGEKVTTYYDAKGRALRSHLLNYLGGHTIADSKLDFTGKPIYTITRQKRTASDTELVIREDYEYSPQDRLLVHSHKIGSGDAQILSSNTYDALGQLVSKKVGGTTSSPLQKVDYAYNIRGWLKSINSVDGLNPAGEIPDLFAFKINYNTVENDANYTGTKLYNGNISETYWRSISDNTKRKYGYAYDGINRLLKAEYIKPGAVVPVTRAYSEYLEYDKNGNILYLERNGDSDEDVATPIDILDYSYDNGNRLLSVSDQTASTTGFKDGTNTDEDDYEYDSFGNLIKDRNKGIAAISYNHLNLPVTINFGSESWKIEYLYTGDGRKVKKKVPYNAPSLAGGIGFTEMDYMGGFHYQGGSLKFFATAEGYVNKTLSIYSYVYNYTDHLGNIRISYAQDPEVPGTLKILEENHYYPFGLKHANYNSGELAFRERQSSVVLRAPVAPTNPVPAFNYDYKYNGKEFQDELGLNVYAYGWRDYDPAIARFMKIDRFAEKYSSVTPYSYAGNNPVYFVDIKGDSLEGVNNKSARRVQREIRNTFKTNKNLANLFKRDGKKFEGISQGDFDDATMNSSTDEKALAQGYFNAVNSSEIHTVEAVKRGEKLESGLSTAFGDTTGADIDNSSGGGFNYKTTTGSHTVVIMNSTIGIPDYRDNNTGMYVVGRTSVAGELLAHELLGHGLTNYNTGGNQFLNAIQLTNLYHRVTTESSRFYRDGSAHGGNPSGSGVAIPGSISSQVPLYLK